MNNTFYWLSRLLSSIAATVSMVSAAQAADVPVYNSNDAFAGSLRQAIQDAPAGSTIVFQIPTSDPNYNSNTGVYTISLSSARLLITKSLTIDAGAQKITIQRSYDQGTPDFQVFYVAGGPVTLANLTIANGRAHPQGSTGGGIYNLGTLTVRNCLVLANDGRAIGGGIFNASSGNLVVSNCTFYANISSQSGALSNDGTLSIDNSTFVGDWSLNPSVGGISSSSSNLAKIRNTIVVGNAGNSGMGAPSDVGGAFVSGGYNLIGGHSGASGFGATGDQVGVSPGAANLVGPLDHGGPTQTFRPLAGSLAIDQGNRGLDANNQPINTDARGLPRPVDSPMANAFGGDGSDIGAVEVGAVQAGPSFTVTTTADLDDGSCTTDHCTLREALTASNANGDANVINFAPGVAGSIRTPAPDSFHVLQPLTINGPGARILRLTRGGSTGRILRIATSGNVAVSGLTIVAGYLDSGNGGGVLVEAGNVTLTDCAVWLNAAAGSQSDGGGVFNAIGATLTLLRCTFSENYAGQFGGGVHNQGTFAATNCTFVSNRALRGGGIISRANAGAARMTLRNCTIVGNYATDGVASPGFGGGGVFAEGGAQQHFVGNNIIAGNTVTNDPDVRGNYTSEGHNLIGVKGDSTGIENGISGDKVGAPPNFGTFGNHGGPTDTVSLLASSAAVNAGNNSLARLTDQRGYLRSNVSDIGAFEFNGTVPPPVPLLSAVSRKTHNGLGPFDVNLPLAGNVGVECRTGGASGNHTLVFTFSNELVSVGAPQVANGVGHVSHGEIGVDKRQYILSLTGVGNAQRLTVSLTNAVDAAGNSSSATPVTLGFLYGDANGDGVINSGDAQQTRNRSGQTTDATTFRSDLNLDGTINSGDATVVRSRSGQFIP